MEFIDFLKGKRNSKKKAQAYVDYQGYILVYKPNHPRARYHGYVLAHYYLWERYHYACLLPWSRIYHKDGNKKNNKKDNLLVRIGSKYRSRVYHTMKSSKST